MPFYVGEKVHVIKEKCKYTGQNVIIHEIHASFNPVLYSCEILHNDKIGAFYEHELESMYAYDIGLLKLWKEMKKDGI